MNKNLKIIAWTTALIAIVFIGLAIFAEFERRPESPELSNEEISRIIGPMQTESLTIRWGGIEDPVLTMGLREGKIYIEGNLEEGARIFFELYLQREVDEYIAKKLEEKR